VYVRVALCVKRTMLMSKTISSNRIVTKATLRWLRLPSFHTLTNHSRVVVLKMRNCGLLQY